MRFLLLPSLILLLWPTFGWSVDILPIQHRIVGDNRTFVRDAGDRRYSIWTDDESKIDGIILELGLPQSGIVGLNPGEVFAVFLNDRIAEDLVQVAFNKSTKQYFADYADSGIEFKLRPLSKDKKYSHLTVVIFIPTETPSHIGMRGMISHGLSDKK